MFVTMPSKSGACIASAARDPMELVCNSRVNSLLLEIAFLYCV